MITRLVKPLKLIKSNIKTEYIFYVSKLKCSWYITNVLEKVNVNCNFVFYNLIRTWIKNKVNITESIVYGLKKYQKNLCVRFLHFGVRLKKFRALLAILSDIFKQQFSKQQHIYSSENSVYVAHVTFRLASVFMRRFICLLFKAGK